MLKKLKLIKSKNSGLREELENIPLIMDIGMNNGRDTLFYLQKGFRVVAVEASPILVKEGEEKFSDYIESGHLIIEPVGLAKKAGKATFYMNLDKDDWSSFIKEFGTRENTRYEEIDINCITPQTLFNKHGIPYYLKIDIEGYDIDVVRALHDFESKPKYISMEEAGAYCFAELWGLGYRNFKIINQMKNYQTKCPFPPLEGNYVDAKFDGTSSGLFGEETEGDWLSFDEVIEKYFSEVRSPTKGFLGGYGWFDIHGRLGHEIGG